MSEKAGIIRRDRERKARLYLDHPDESPELVDTLPYLIHPPSKLSATVCGFASATKRYCQ